MIEWPPGGRLANNPGPHCGYYLLAITSITSVTFNDLRNLGKGCMGPIERRVIEDNDNLQVARVRLGTLKEDVPAAIHSGQTPLLYGRNRI